MSVNHTSFISVIRALLNTFDETPVTNNSEEHSYIRRPIKQWHRIRLIYKKTKQTEVLCELMQCGMNRKCDLGVSLFSNNFQTKSTVTQCCCFSTASNCRILD